MKNRIWLFIILFFSFGVKPFAAGNRDNINNEIKTQNDEWILCISNFDSSSLPENKASVADVIMRKLVESLNAINFRTRITSEYAYYEETAWARARSDAAKAIASKQNERSMLLYRGDSERTYLRNIERIDADLEKLYSELEKIDKAAPAINTHPVFSITKDNLEYKFPAAPAAGNEYRFCLEQKSDALLTGSIIDFHERFIVSLKLYAVYTQSFVWESSVVFSHDDLESAVDECARGLIITLSGGEPAILSVRAEPEETLLLINNAFAGRGEMQSTEYPPGTITVNASAPEYKDLTFKVELFPGENTEIKLNLMPIEYANVEITGNQTGRIYQGALYAGEAPLTLRLPLNQMEYLELETSDEVRASAVFNASGGSELNYSLILPDAVRSVDGQVNRARNVFYWAWGSTLATAAAAWLSYHSYVNSNSAISSNYSRTGSYNQNFYNNNNTMYYVSMGTLIATGVAVAIDIFLITRYIKAANKGNTAVTETGRN